MYIRIDFPPGRDYSSTTTIGQSGTTTSRVPTIIPVGTPVYIYMTYSFKTSVRGIRMDLYLLSSYSQFASTMVRSYLEGTGSGTLIKSVSTQREISQNDRINIMLINHDDPPTNFSTSDYVRWQPALSYMIFGTFTPVVKGDLIKSTDFTAVNQTATIGEKITNSNFTSNTIITADEWNNKWKIS